MEKYWLLLVLVPTVWLGAMSASSRAVKTQPCLTAARSAYRFRVAVDRSGGREDALRGLVLDGVFVLLVLVFVPWAFAAADDGWWWLTGVAAGSFDLVEDVLLWWLVRGEVERRAPYLVVFVLSWLKYAAYALILVGIGFVVC